MDQNLYYTEKIFVIEVDMIDKNSDNIEKKNNEFRNKNNFELLDAWSYINAIKLIYI